MNDMYTYFDDIDGHIAQLELEESLQDDSEHRDAPKPANSTEYGISDMSTADRRTGHTGGRSPEGRKQHRR